MGLNEIEMKLLRLALNKGAYSGEAENAGIMLIRKLRERNVSAEDLFAEAEASRAVSVSRFGEVKMTFGKHKGEMLKDIPAEYLVWVYRNCDNISGILYEAIENVIYGD